MLRFVLLALEGVYRRTLGICVRSSEVSNDSPFYVGKCVDHTCTRFNPCKLDCNVLISRSQTRRFLNLPVRTDTESA